MPTSVSSGAHASDPDQVVSELGVDPTTGLDSREVAERRRRWGDNRVGSDDGVRPWRILVDQVASAVVALLAAAAVAGLALGEVVEAAAIGVVLVVNTLVGFLTEWQAARSMAALADLTSTVADVERDDRRDEVDAVGLVPGDVVVVEGGERVPADIRLLEAEDLSVEESTLTGESEPVTKQAGPVDADAVLAERTCMLYMGTTVRAGRGRGVVVATGGRTEVGTVASLAASTESRRAPLQAALDQLSRRLSVGVVGLAVLLVGIGLVRGRELQEVVEIAIALAIAVVPEGLPAVATLTLAVGMRRMSRRNALVRRLSAVETLGSTTALGSDKTGTLTRNQMSVVEVALGDEVVEQELWRTATLCNDADVDVDGDPVGDPTEVALLRAARSSGLDWRDLRESSPREREVPFSSDTMRMATVHRGVVHVKGAPEALLSRDHPLRREAERMGEDALRTLVLARRRDPGDAAVDDTLFEDLEVLGIVGMKDPPRHEVIDAIDELRDAGVRTIMITGDRPDTARAIASELGLDTSHVVTGRQVADTPEAEIAGLVSGVQVFARVSPAQKLRIVEALRTAGDVVAVTGDGVNDAPALSRADVGVAMGSGTDVAHEASDVVLVDDDVSTVTAAVEEGRRVFENIRRFAQFLFSWHLAEVAVITVALLAGMPAPLAGLMILWNNLVIDVLPSFALALEPGRAEVMQEPPRDPAEPVITSTTLRRIVAQGAMVAAVGLVVFTLAGRWLGLDLDGQRTATFLAMSAAQTLGVFNARTTRGSGFVGASRNPWLWLALVATAALEAVALLVPGLRDLLGLVAPSGAMLGLAAVLAALPLLVTQVARAGAIPGPRSR